MLKTLVPLALAVTTTAAIGAATYAPLQRQSLLEATLPAANPPVRLIRGARIRFAPGQPLGRHYHPATVIGVVTEGSFRYQEVGGPDRLLKVGDTFIEPADKRIAHFNNALPNKPSVLTVFYLTDSKDRPLIEELKDE